MCSRSAFSSLSSFRPNRDFPASLRIIERLLTLLLVSFAFIFCLVLHTHRTLRRTVLEH
jgi:hypothetical protein